MSENLQVILFLIITTIIGIPSWILFMMATNEAEDGKMKNMIGHCLLYLVFSHY